MNYQTIEIHFQETICFLRFNRTEDNNTINSLLIEECHQVLDLCEELANIVVLEGLPEVFCFGADFQDMYAKMKRGQQIDDTPEPLYKLWLKLANGPFITISHVRGKVNAGGMGFVASSDIVLADESVQFSLSELLFGLLPACVLPFLIRRIGFQKANYMTLTTQPISVQQALAWGLVDACEAQSENLLRKHLLRLRYIPKIGIQRYKRYMNNIQDSLVQSKSLAISTNQEVFSDPRNIERIVRYIETGQIPLEK